VNKIISGIINATRKIRWVNVMTWLEGDYFSLFLGEATRKAVILRRRSVAQRSQPGGELGRAPRQKDQPVQSLRNKNEIGV